MALEALPAAPPMAAFTFAFVFEIAAFMLAAVLAGTWLLMAALALDAVFVKDLTAVSGMVLILLTLILLIFDVIDSAMADALLTAAFAFDATASGVIGMEPSSNWRLMLSMDCC